MGLFIGAVILGIIAMGGFGLAVVSGRFPEADRSFARGIGLAVGAIAGVLSLGALLASSYNQVNAGEVGVVVRFGEVQGTVGPGAHFLAPWKDVVAMDTKLKEATFSSDADGTEGLGPISAQARGGGNLSVEMTVQYNLRLDAADEVYQTIGKDYFKVAVLPAARECVRNVTPDYTAEEVYTVAREKVAQATLRCVRTDLESRGLDVADVKIRDVDPGEKVRTAIDNKIAAEQDLQRKEIEKAQAIADAEIRLTEAQGIAEADRAITSGISQNLLVFRYIEALKELVNSPNNTVIILPFDQALTPLLNIQQGGPR